MWDDDAGDGVSGVSEVARIYIDQLPSRLTGGPPIPWTGCGITRSDVDATLLGTGSGAGRGLLIRVRRPSATDGEPSEYHLHEPRMYGVAESVRVVVKSKRLVVKIKKKRNRLGTWGKSNLRPWPQLGEKEVGSGNSAGAGGAINEDMFKRDMDPAISGGFDEKLFSGKKKK